MDHSGRRSLQGCGTLQRLEAVPAQLTEKGQILEKPRDKRSARRISYGIRTFLDKKHSVYRSLVVR